MLPFAYLGVGALLVLELGVVLIHLSLAVRLTEPASCTGVASCTGDITERQTAMADPLDESEPLLPRVDNGRRSSASVATAQQQKKGESEPFIALVHDFLSAEPPARSQA